MVGATLVPPPVGLTPTTVGRPRTTVGRPRTTVTVVGLLHRGGATRALPTGGKAPAPLATGTAASPQCGGSSGEAEMSQESVQDYHKLHQ